MNAQLNRAECRAGRSARSWETCSGGGIKLSPYGRQSGQAAWVPVSAPWLAQPTLREQRTQPTFPHRRAQDAPSRAASPQPRRPLLFISHSARSVPPSHGGVSRGRGGRPTLPTPADLLVFTVDLSGGRFEWTTLCGPRYSPLQGWGPVLQLPAPRTYGMNVSPQVCTLKS